jgi:hypothetical protein
MIRRLLAVIAGIAVAVLLVMLIQNLGHKLYPPPVDLDLNDQAFMKEYVANLPWGPLAFVIASYVIATLAGGWVAVVIAVERPLLYTAIVAAFVLAGVISTVLTIPHPTWFTTVAIAGIILAALLAAGLASHVGSIRKVI